MSISLVGNPNLENSQDPKRRKIIELCQKVSCFDPEFILKVGTRKCMLLKVRSLKYLAF